MLKRFSLVYESSVRGQGNRSWGSQNACERFFEFLQWYQFTPDIRGKSPTKVWPPVATAHLNTRKAWGVFLGASRIVGSVECEESSFCVVLTIQLFGSGKGKPFAVCKYSLPTLAGDDIHDGWSSVAWTFTI